MSLGGLWKVAAVKGVYGNEKCRSKIIRKCRQSKKETTGRKQEINKIGKNKIKN